MTDQKTVRDSTANLRDMAAHNFHIYLILDLEEKKGLDHKGKLFLRKVAIDTFKSGLERRP